MKDPFDVAVIGAGVVGTAIARTLARYRLSCLLLEAGADVGIGTSKANTAILHTGFDARPGTLEARLVRRGHALLGAYAARVGIPVERTGALLVAWHEAERAALPAIAATAAANGYAATRPLAADELYTLEPRLGPGAQAGLAIPDESLVCPFTTPLAFATDAVVNGTRLVLDCPVTAVHADGDAHALATPQGVFHARWVVNAAGLFADTVDRLFGHDAFTIVPRRGELIVFDKLARPLVRHILLPVPGAKTKGVLVTPTVFGNVVLGPTAEDVDDRTATGTTAAGLAGLLAQGGRIVPALVGEEVVATYAGLRAATDAADYRIGFHPGQRYCCVGGIRSTGLTASLAIAEYVVEGLADGGLTLVPRDDVCEVHMPELGETGLRPYQDAARIRADADYGRIVCHCERVTRGEILDACRTPVPARSLDGVRRRTRALFGRCQGFYCAVEVARLVAGASGRSMRQLFGGDEG